MKNKPFVNREISWLHFNARVLQEAEDKNVPLISRLRFLGIFSNNLDEFFKVRYATVKQIVKSGEYSKKLLGNLNPVTTLDKITEIVIHQQAHSLKVLENIIQELKNKNIFVIDETEVSDEQNEYIRIFFNEKISNSLSIIILDDHNPFPILKDTRSYLAVQLVLNPSKKPESNETTKIAIIEIPKHINRFVVLPKKGNKDYVILIDDIIRLSFPDIFKLFEYRSASAYMIKITRDSDLDLENDLTKSFVKKIEENVKGREVSKAVRFIYDKTMNQDMLDYLIKRMQIDDTDSIIPGGKYHNRRDYINFPEIGHPNLVYSKIKPLPLRDLNKKGSFLKKVAKKDYLQFVPYHFFSNLVVFLREAALDPDVTSIKITLYRLADTSNVINSLINAAKNGKEVIVFIELRARFDEKANINHAEMLKEAGVRIITEIPTLKVHSKICVVSRNEKNNKVKYYGFIGTGNFNENSAKIYTDFTLFTASQDIMKELNKVFSFLESNYITLKFKHLIVSPHHMEKSLVSLINNEIKNAKAGLPAYIKLKINSITNYRMIKKLYQASQAGVKIQMIVRGVCCLVPGVKGISENIEAISIVDKFLEHSRLYIFCNNNNPKVFMSSADWMTRSIKHRVEVSCPIYDKDLVKEVIDLFDIGWNDNVKARVFSKDSINEYKPKGKEDIRSQISTYEYYKNKL